MNRTGSHIPRLLLAAIVIPQVACNSAYAGTTPDNPAVAVVAELGPKGQCFGSPFHQHEKAQALFKQEPLKAGDEVRCDPPGEVDIAWLHSSKFLIYKKVEWYMISAVLRNDSERDDEDTPHPGRYSSIKDEIHYVGLMRAQVAELLGGTHSATRAPTTSLAGWKQSSASVAAASAAVPTYSFAALTPDSAATQSSGKGNFWRRWLEAHDKGAKIPYEVITSDQQAQDVLKSWSEAAASATAGSVDTPASAATAPKLLMVDAGAFDTQWETSVGNKVPANIIVLNNPSDTDSHIDAFSGKWTFVDPSLWQAAIAGADSEPRKHTLADRVLEKKVMAALKAEGLANARVEVNADAKSGTVALGGVVPVPSWAARATYTATQVNGVKAVQDDIFVDLVPPNVSTARH